LLRDNFREKSDVITQTETFEYVNTGTILNDSLLFGQELVVGRLNHVPELIVSCVVYSIVVLGIDFLLVLFFMQELSQLIATVSLILVLEGGLGLTFGGVIAMYSPVVSKVGEILFRSEPWNQERRKTSEKQGQVLIVVGLFLLLIGLVISAI